MLKLASRHRGRTAVVLAVALAVSAFAALVGSAGALTAPNPTAPVAITFSTPTTNLDSGDVVTFQAQVTGGTTSNVAAHICKTPPGGPISNSGDFGFGGDYCVKFDGIQPVAGFPGLGTGSLANYESSVPQANLATSTPVSITAGAGAVAWLNDSGVPLTLTCGVGSPCDLVIEVQINVSPFTTYFTQPLSFAAAPTAPGVPTGVTALAGDTQVNVSWVAPADDGNSPITQYVVTQTPPGGVAGEHTVPGTSTSLLVTGLSNGTSYSFTVRARNAIGDSAESASASATPNALSRVLLQPITVTRPNGELVLTQACSPTGANPYPDEGIAAGDIVTTPTVTYGAPTSAGCTIPLGSAKLLKGGVPGAGQFFKAEGPINELTIVDTRDTDPGFVVSASAVPFTSGLNSFSANDLGITPSASDTGPFVTDDGSYDQVLTAAAAVLPKVTGTGITPGTGLGTPRTVASAISGKGLGIAKVNGQLKLLIPIFAKTGNYDSILTITAI